MEAEKKWYEKAEWIYILVLLFWPVGLFLLWKNKEIPKKNKLIMTGIFLVLLVIGLLMNGEKIFDELFRMIRRLT
ncbi:MAG: hypothetical protein QNK23_15295 [Crocinitomicaceae bacterium]|nr:hypothetical protein [Crocinitomicaceae bacterium]